MEGMLHTILFYTSLVFLVPSVLVFILGTGLSARAQGTYQTSHFDALSQRGGTQTHEYHYEEQDELGQKMYWWTFLPLIAGIVLYPGMVWWVKIIVFIVGLFLIFIIGLLLPEKLIETLAIWLKVRQKPLTLEEKEEQKKQKRIYDLVQVVGSQEDIAQTLQNLDPEQQADFMDCIKTVLDDYTNDNKRYQCMRVLGEYVQMAKVQ